MGLTISDWGPSAWNTLHVVAHTYPMSPTDDHKRETYEFLHLFAKHLPCPSCRDHFMELLYEEISSIESEHLTSRKNMVKFMNDTHNSVNLRLGKRVFTLEEHYKVYTPESKPRFVNLIYITLVIITIWGVGKSCRRRKQFEVRS